MVVVATGATEHKPQSYGYGQSDKVLTQLELSERLARGDLALPESATVVMIQCVEQRDEQRPYCSRVCCTSAVKNALALAPAVPQGADHGALPRHADLRIPRGCLSRGAGEGGPLRALRARASRRRSMSTAACECGSKSPRCGAKCKSMPISWCWPTPMVPRADREELSELLRVPLNADGFFLEAHMKLRPVDFASEGLFLCGTAHAPKFLSEAIAQAHAVAGRAASILSRRTMPSAARRPGSIRTSAFPA